MSAQPADDYRIPGSAYFGEPWASGICEDGYEVPAPIGKICFHCSEPIDTGEQGSFIYANASIPECIDEQHLVMVDSRGMNPVHRECGLRAVLGGIGHHRDHAYWCTEMHDPDGGFSYRQSSLKVWELAQKGELFNG